MQIPTPEKVIVHNPLTFTRATGIAKAELNEGGLGRDGNSIYPQVYAAEIHNDIVWVSRPEIPFKSFVPKNLHPADYNLYWMTIRKNVADRIAIWENNNTSQK